MSGATGFRRNAAGEIVPLPERFIEAMDAGRTIDGHALGAILDAVDFRDRQYDPRLIQAPFSSQIPDLSWLKVRDQSFEGSCTGQALAAVIDIQNRARWQHGGGTGAAPQPVSARMLYQMARAYDGIEDGAAEGSTLRGALKGFFHNGVCPDEMAPYFAGQPGWHLTAECAKAAQSTSLGGYYRLAHKVHDYIAALAETGAIFASAMLHAGWKTNPVRESGGHILLPEPAAPAGLLDGPSYPVDGMHAFAIVGYDDDGFLVLNSFGSGWGGFRGQGGLAHWDYEDWSLHVLDAWVISLGTCSGRAFHLAGGYSEGRPARGRSTFPRFRVNGHYVHFRRGDFQRHGAYPTNGKSLEEIRALLTASDDGAAPDPRYAHLLLWIESGLDDLDVMVRRAALLVPILKRQGVYPIFLWWHTGFAQQIEDLLAAVAGRLAARTGDLESERNPLLEDFAATCLSPLWADLERLAEETVNGDAGTSLDGLLRTASDRGMNIHLVAHGAGAQVACHLLNRLAEPGDRPEIATTSLLAPICRVEAFPAARAGRVSLFHLPAAWEAEDSVGPYRGSWLRLVGRALADPVDRLQRRSPDIPRADALDGAFLGTAEAATAMNVAAISSTVPTGTSDRPHSLARNHRGFPDDAATVESILGSVLNVQSLPVRNPPP